MINHRIGAAPTNVETPLRIAEASENPKQDHFGATLDLLTANFVEPIRSAEAAAAAAMAGKMPAQEAILQVMQAERTLQTGIALRDRAVAAYQEIMRMNI